MISSVLIGVATYKRPQLLQGLLQSIELQDWAGEIHVVVVDNDPEGSASDIAGESDLFLTYCVESKPGIAAARNRGLSLLGSESAVVFVDDDEIAESHWLSALVATAEQTGADIVAGPVLSLLPDDAPRWAKRWNPYERARGATGSEVKWPATNNTLVRAEVIREFEGNWFSESFSLTGGSDAEFFWRAKRAGYHTAWSDEAVVSEIVPPDRLSLRWLWRRGVRLGNVSGRLLSRDHATWIVQLIGALRICAGSLLGPWALLRRRRPVEQFMHIPKGVGMINSTRGRILVEYAREGTSNN